MDRLRLTARGMAVFATAAILVGIALAPANPASLLALSARQPPAASQQEAPEGFEPVGNLPQREQLPAAPLLIAAYAFAWVMILAFVWSVWRRLGAVQKELADIERRLEETRRR